MNLKESEQGDVVVLQLLGDVMGGPEAQTVNERVRQLVAEGRKQFVVDVANVRSMNSSGLGVLIAGLAVVRNAGGDLRLARPAAKVKKLLEITKLSGVFGILDSVEKAVDSFRAA